MSITIINDCRDSNAQGRQVTRASALFASPVSFIGVENDVEAAGNIIDTFDALRDQSGVVIVNIAPRNGEAKQWENGTPFGYFWYKNILCVSSIDGYTLSLVKKLNLVDSIRVLDIQTSLEEALYSPDEAKAVSESQFRSFDFLPRIAFHLHNNHDVQAEELPLSDIPDIPPTVWWVDNFGNAKTTLLPEELDLSNGSVATTLGTFPYYKQLKEVPDDTAAIIVGSSGIEDARFLEIVVQGKSAAEELGIASAIEL